MIEVLLAVSIFMILTTGAIIALVSAYNANRLAEEEMVAAQYASEGIEASRSIRNQGWAYLGYTVSTGVRQNATLGVWEYNGAADNIFDSRYTRVIKVETVNRDGNGNIVLPPSGTPDPNTKKVTSKVSWDFTAARQNDITFTQYLHKWQSTLGGIVIYEDGTNSPKFRDFNISSGIFEAERSADQTSSPGRAWSLKTSPKKLEAIAGYVNSLGVLRVICFDGTSWSDQWGAAITVGGTGTTKRFGIAYESNSGDAIIVYSQGSASANALSYRTKPGSTGCGGANWTSAQSLPTSPALITGTVQWVRLDGSPIASTDRVAAAWSDNNSRLGAAIWDGSAWGNLPTAALETNLERVTSAGDSQSFDLAIESLTGNVLVAWGVLTTTSACTAGSNCMRYSRFTTAWSAAAAVPTVADSATNIDLTPNPDTNQIALVGIDNGTASQNANDLSLGYWSGTAWQGNKANFDTSTQTPIAGSKMVASGWLISGATTRVVFVYNDSNSRDINWITCTPGSTFPCTNQSDYSPDPRFTNPQRWYEIKTDPVNKNQFVFVLSDSHNDLYAKKLSMTTAPAFTWSDTEGGNPLESSLTQNIASPFAFGYWRI
ncbi:MAG: hypothetical protein UX31_C0026G0007 [Candidatus Nomurabacteria bacterium GW2011_GWA1_46_11]|uniref:Uncharacterized protein n=1 Tax=Candidatus Nomurabacteria bacterium GW2011_GWA1_46_11 TaxID=1618732 RepID=A0A0G1QSW5_9BACT|nr:MAG: hypothetical protein UW73_C0032G0007 [Microgenomates group bacterium GW2011_GWB1_44_8]KKU20853.1 MAG: hypothetical protein UX31_C0026G0007 [Candidatus Nomurabacteria bacterium GW2011_GWA1_46_11]